MMSRATRSWIAGNIAAAGIVLLMGLLSGGCVSHVRDLRDAQEQFNTASGIENRLRLSSESPASDPVMLRGQADAAYRLAAVMLTEVIGKNRKELEKDRLLGTAYTMKALSEWRLGEYAAALRTLEESRAEKSLELFPRDKALQNALEGLIMNDQAARHMRARDYDYAATRTLLRGALDGIARGMTDTARGDAVRLYLLMSEMAVLKNWIDLRGDPGKFAISVPVDFKKEMEIASWCERAVPVWRGFVDELGLLEREQATMLQEYWGRRLTMPATCPTPGQ